MRFFKHHKLLEPLFLVLTLILFVLLPAGTAKADIYRFVTVDGVETFSDIPVDKDAKIVIKDQLKKSNSKSARNLSRESKHTQPPSLNEIIEKTVQARINPEASSSNGIEAVLPVNGVITSSVGMRIDPIDGHWRYHNGIDIAVPTGTPVKAVSSGVVIYSDFRGGYGWTVLVEHDNGMISLSGHNSRNMVTSGQAVKKGDIIALSGSTGRSTGPHVHFEVWQSGNNITAAFMPGSTAKIASSATSVRRHAHFRKEILSDGSLLITNMDSAIP